MLWELYLRGLRWWLNLVACVIGAIFNPSKQRYLPPIKSRILLESATSLAKKIKTGELKSEDVVRIFIDRCREVNEDINAIVDDNYKEALDEARRVDQMVEREISGHRNPNDPSIHDFPFLGVPFTAKNSVAVKGKTFSGATWSRRDMIATEDANVVQRMKKIGGAIFLGVTNIPELVMWIDSYNTVDGRTNNPYDKARIPGGSSGGEGAIIGAAGSVIGIGTDIAGSIRIPSNFCGIFGHKTTPKLGLCKNIYPPVKESRAKMASVGPMCRYVEDVRPMLKVMMGGEVYLDDRPLDYNNLKVHYLPSIDDPSVVPVDLEIAQGLKRVVHFFESRGLNPTELDTKNRFYDFRWTLFIWNAIFYDKDDFFYLDRLTQHNRSSINPYIELVKSFFGLSHYTFPPLLNGIIEETIAGYNKDTFIETRDRLRKNLHHLLGKNGVLLCPTFPEIAFKHSQTNLKVNSVVYTALWNTMDVSITTVPLGLDRHGMPYSISVIAAPYNDNLAIQVAEELGRHFGGWVPPCPVHIKQHAFNGI